ncbi:MAG: hypothetical protein ACR2RB_05140 [Gammaproteobacteria bacterium]
MARLASGVLLVISILFSVTDVKAQQLAFPTAEGFGRFTQGGRGGRVIEVSTLRESGAGSLRACLEATGARTCVFTTSGTIHLNKG